MAAKAANTKAKKNKLDPQKLYEENKFVGFMLMTNYQTEKTAPWHGAVYFGATRDEVAQKIMENHRGQSIDENTWIITQITNDFVRVAFKISDKLVIK